MGRHGRPDAVRRARSRTFRAAATAGVLSTLAFAYYSATADTSTPAKYDAKSRFDVTPGSDGRPDLEHADPTASSSPGGFGGSNGGDSADRKPAGAEPTASSSAPPRLLQNPDQAPQSAGPAYEHGKQGDGRSSANPPSTGGQASPGGGTSTPSPAPSQAEGSSGSGNSAPGDGKKEKSGPVTNTVETVGDVVDSVVGGLTGGLLGG